MIKEAKGRRQNKEEVWAIGVDKDQYADGIYEGDKSVILTSMVKRVDVAAFDIALKTLKGEFPGGKDNLYNIANNGVGIPVKNPNLTEDVLKKVEEAREKIKSGSVKVPTVPSRLEKK
jgi:membrane lipoprotein tmpC